ncbi:T9SS type A sorting domain-containing protein [Flavobacterium fluviatile]|uniref:T9SS type A sorting domain-containing protein n=1 Tax=Flavobacterium fluviatile TaxID=1862387 RepID=UPI0013CFCC1E|nr:T9SS type A sorting domain-containing protein [Flavobacterium fluviatile]
MKKYLLLLLVFTRFLGYSQTTQATVSGLSEGSRTVTFVNPVPIEIDGTPTIISATVFGGNNGAIVITFKGGSNNYNYILTKKNVIPNTPISDLTKLTAGDYIIIAEEKESGCKSEPYEFTINQPDKLVVTIEGTAIKCHGGDTGTLSVLQTQGGTIGTGYTYEWFKHDGSEFVSTGRTGASISKPLTAGRYKVEVTDKSIPANTESSNEFIITQPSAPITVTESKTNVSCNGGSNGTISLTINGGTAGYSILWNDGVITTHIAGQPDRAGLVPGNYYYTISDTNDCKYYSTDDIIITAPPVLNISSITPTQPTNATSNDGKITITATGGTGAYTYFLTKGGITTNYSSNTITNLENGTYEVFVKDANNCTSLSSTVKLEALAVTLVTQQNVLCYGVNTGSLKVQASGGTLSSNSEYKYQWYKGADKIDNETNAEIKNLSEGSYTVQVMDDKMIPVTSITYTITSPVQELSVTSNAATQQQNVSCNGGNDGKIEISVSGGTCGYTYKWNDGPTSKDRSGLTEGTYSVTVTDANGCEKTLTGIVISEPEKITIPTPAIKDVAINGQSTGSILFPSDPLGGNGNYSYQWTSNNGYSASTRDLNGIKAGTYYLTISDKELCLSTPYTFTVDEQPKLEVTIKESAFIKCNGDSNGRLVAEVTGGVAPYKYRWEKNGVTLSGENSSSLPAIGFGDYSVYVTDSANPEPGPFAAAQQLNFKLTQPDVLKVSLAKQTNVLCHGDTTGAIEIAIEGGTAPYTQQWTKNGVIYTGNLNQLEKGEYNVIVTDAVGHGCTATLNQPVTITQPAAPLQVSSPGPVHLKGFETADGSISVTVSGGTPNYTYQWRKDTSATIIGTGSSITGLAAGVYHLLVKDANNCTLPEINYTVNQPDKLEVVSLTQTPFTDIACKGNLSGEYTMIVKGGVKEYSFEWRNTTTGTKYTSTETILAESTTSKASGLGAGNYVVTVKDANSNTLFGTNTFTITEPDLLTFTYTTQNVSCFEGNNGSIKLNISGGTKSSDITKPYTIYSSGTIDYQNGIISGLSAGTYIIKVGDANNCQTPEQTITITEPSASVYIANSTVTPATGFGLTTGKIAITASGGTIGYNYQWKNNSGSVVGANSPNLINAAAGTYSVLVTDASGCTASGVYTIDQPAKPVLTETHQSSKCNGLLGSLEATATGGATYNQNQADRVYTYKLKNKTSGAVNSISGNIASFTNIADGEYTLTATDISGVDSNTVDVLFTQPTPIVVSLVSKTNVNCFGDKDGSITISVSGGTPLTTAPEYTYQWKKKNTVTNIYENFTPTALNQLYAGIYAIEVRDANYNASDAVHCIGILEDIEITQPDDFKFDIDKITYTNPTALNGNDGTLHFEVTGGKPNYEYKFYTKNTSGTEIILKTISDSSLKTADFTGLVKDHYYISAKDDTGCTKYTDFDFRDNPLTISVNQTQNISCYDANNAIIKINADGGYGQKKYSWYRNNALLVNEDNDILLNAKPGNYYAVVKDSKKVEVTSNTIIVTQPDPLAFTTTQEPVKCLGDSNGKITLTASGGNGNFSYRYFNKGILVKDWQSFTNATNTTISDLAQSDYTIYVKDFQGCESPNAIIKITSPTALSSTASTSAATGKGLSNGSAAITAQGGNGSYTYKWFKSDNTNISQNTNTATNLAAGKYYVIVSDAKGCELTSPLLEVTEPPLLETVIAVQNVILCNGDKNGSLKPTTTGGFLKPGDSYTYQWLENGNPTVLASTTILNGIGKGSYFVIATDSNGNKATSPILTVTEPAVLANSLTSDYVLCGDFNDWTINATPSGGTQPYNYAWNTGAKTASIQNVPPGNYSVVVSDSHGCTITKTITLTAPVHLDASANTKIPTCYGGSDATITVTPIAGIAPYTYLWNTGEKTNTLSNAPAGDYSVSITDSKGCVISRNYTIVDPPKDVINLGDDVTLCWEQTLTINAAINDDQATYKWKSDKGFSSNNAMITVSEPANYTVTVTNKLGCEATDTIQIFSQNTAISAEFAVSSQVFQNEKIVIVDISNPAADEIEWILPAKANVITKNKDYAEISFSEAGTYDVTLNTKKGNCTAFQTKQILVTEGEYEGNPDDEPINEKKFDLKIYPNPSQGIFTVDVTLDKVMPANVKVYNLNNNLLIDSKTGDGKDNYLFNFNLGGLPPGLYFVLFESQQGSKLRKIIIQ